MYLLFLALGFVIQRINADILALSYHDHFIEEEFRDLPSTFGNGLPYEGMHGMLQYASPAEACNSIAKAPSLDSNPTGKWIVIIARYNCSFERKVRMAQEANYDAVIVHNVKSDYLEQMSAKNSSGIHIPSVFVGESTGMLLKEIYTKADYFIIINSEAPFNINTHLLLPFVIVVGVCFLVMMVFMVAKCIRDRRRQRRERLTSSSLNKIPTCKFQKGDPYETCAICLDDYVEGEKLRVLPCAHAYHTKCIDPWLTKNRRVCPVCKRRVFAYDETRYHDTDSDTESDDTTPLLTSRNQVTTEGGTFGVGGGVGGGGGGGGGGRDGGENGGGGREAAQEERGFIRSLISQYTNYGNYITASDDHSINGELADESDVSTDSTSDEVETRPSTSNTQNNRGLIV